MSGRRNLAVAHAGHMTWDPPEVRCRGCECRFDSWQAFGEHVDRLLSAPPRSRTQAVEDVLADHLGDFGSEGGVHQRPWPHRLRLWLDGEGPGRRGLVRPSRHRDPVRAGTGSHG